MSGTLTIVIGLCGAGKSWFLNKMRQTHPTAAFFDEGLSDRGKSGVARRKAVAAKLKRGGDVFVGDLWCGWAPRRKAVLKHLKQLVPNLKVVWFFYENTPRKANQNCRKRNRGRRDPAGHITINRRWSKRLTKPKGAIVLQIHMIGRN
jgi:hypothetical protein